MNEIVEINKYLEYFYKINPLFKYGNKTQRSAMERIVKKLGEEKTIAAIEYAISIQGIKYAPTIASPLQLENKMGELVIFWKKQHNQIIKNYD